MYLPSSKRIYVLMCDSPRQLKIHFPSQEMHILFSAWLNFVTDVAVPH